jgi:hypothetical protein
MFDPAQLRVALRVALLRHAANLPGVIEKNGTRTRRSLVEGEDISGRASHGAS